MAAQWEGDESTSRALPTVTVPAHCRVHQPPMSPHGVAQRLGIFTSSYLVTRSVAHSHTRTLDPHAGGGGGGVVTALRWMRVWVQHGWHCDDGGSVARDCAEGIKEAAAWLGVVAWIVCAEGIKKAAAWLEAVACIVWASFVLRPSGTHAH